MTMTVITNRHFHVAHIHPAGRIAASPSECRTNQHHDDHQGMNELEEHALSIGNVRKKFNANPVGSVQISAQKKQHLDDFGVLVGLLRTQLSSECLSIGWWTLRSLCGRVLPIQTSINCLFFLRRIKWVIRRKKRPQCLCHREISNVGGLRLVVSSGRTAGFRRETPYSGFAVIERRGRQ